MPKEKASTRETMERFVRESGAEVFTTDGTVLSCRVCVKPVNAEKKYFVQQHVQSAGHQNRSQRTGRTDTTVCLLTNFPDLSSRRSPSNMDLCQMMVESNIPLFKVGRPSFRDFLEKYTKNKVPDHTTLRKQHLRKLYDATISRIRASIGESRIWISMDESTDVKGQYVVNTIIGRLSAEEPSTPFLIGAEVVDRTNHATIAQAFTNSLRLLWPDELHHDRVLLSVSDAASYMIKAGNGLKILFPKLVHITCLAHAVHRVCEKIQDSFPVVDKFIANVKKTFIKGRARVRIFQTTASDLALPPEPIETRWGSWLSAVLYHAKNFEHMELVIAELNGKDAMAVRISKELLKSPTLKTDLSFIATSYAAIPALMAKLECSTQTLGTTFDLLRAVKQNIENAERPVGKVVKMKLKRVLGGNPDLEELANIELILQGRAAKGKFPELSISDISSLKFAPLVSVDCERSFSRYKMLLTDRRHRLTPENAKFHIILMCNAVVLDVE